MMNNTKVTALVNRYKANMDHIMATADQAIANGSFEDLVDAAFAHRNTQRMLDSLYKVLDKTATRSDYDSPEKSN